MSLASNFRNILEAMNRKIGFKLDKEEAKDIYASKTDVSNSLSKKADKKDTATKVELNAAIASVENNVDDAYLKGESALYTITSDTISQSPIQLKEGLHILTVEMDVTANINEFTDCYVMPLDAKPLEKGKYYKIFADGKNVYNYEEMNICYKENAYAVTVDDKNNEVQIIVAKSQWDSFELNLERIPFLLNRDKITIYIRHNNIYDSYGGVRSGSPIELNDLTIIGYGVVHTKDICCKNLKLIGTNEDVPINFFNDSYYGGEIKENLILEGNVISKTSSSDNYINRSDGLGVHGKIINNANAILPIGFYVNCDEIVVAYNAISENEWSQFSLSILEFSGRKKVVIKDGVTAIYNNINWNRFRAFVVEVPNSLNSSYFQSSNDYKPTLIITEPDNTYTYPCFNQLSKGNFYIEDDFVYTDETKTELITHIGIYQDQIVVPEEVNIIGSFNPKFVYNLVHPNDSSTHGAKTVNAVLNDHKATIDGYTYLIVGDCDNREVVLDSLSDYDFGSLNYSSYDINKLTIKNCNLYSGRLFRGYGIKELIFENCKTYSGGDITYTAQKISGSLTIDSFNSSSFKATRLTANEYNLTVTCDEDSYSGNIDHYLEFYTNYGMPYRYFYKQKVNLTIKDSITNGHVKFTIRQGGNNMPIEEVKLDVSDSDEVYLSCYGGYDRLSITGNATIKFYSNYSQNVYFNTVEIFDHPSFLLDGPGRPYFVRLYCPYRLTDPTYPNSEYVDYQPFPAVYRENGYYYDDDTDKTFLSFVDFPGGKSYLTIPALVSMVAKDAFCQGRFNLIYYPVVKFENSNARISVYDYLEGGVWNVLNAEAIKSQNSVNDKKPTMWE